MSDQIIDATILSATKQRNSDGENVYIKWGVLPESWKAKPSKLR
jgi:hypothetical protein